MTTRFSSHYKDECELHHGDEYCTMGRLVPNSQLPESANPFASRASAGTNGVCTTKGNFPLPGCQGFVSCVPTANGGFIRSEYVCSGNMLWDETIAADFCIDKSQISTCSVPRA
jgi:hypothetical protein